MAWIAQEVLLKRIFQDAYNQGFADAIAKKKDRDVEREAENWIDDQFIGKRRKRDE